MPQTCRPPRGHAWLRLCLAVLLAFAPLLTAAQPHPTMIAGGPAGTAPDAHKQMPCHAGGGATAPAAPQADCPHCNGDAPLSHCQCCDQAAPAGVMQLPAGTDHRATRGGRYHAGLPDALPPSHDDRLYRPPIPSS